MINLAIDAGVSAMSLTILDQYGVMFSPDLVISYDGANDIWLTLEGMNVLPDYANYIHPLNDRIVSLQYVLPHFLLDYYSVTYFSYAFDRLFKLDTYLPDQVWHEVPTQTDKALYSGMPLFLRNIRLMRGVCREYGCNFIASIPHNVDPDATVTAFDYYARTFFDKENIPYLDVQNILPHGDYSIHTDDVHWTDEGLDTVAETWKEKIITEDLLSIEATGTGRFRSN